MTPDLHMRSSHRFGCMALRTETLPFEPASPSLRPVRKNRSLPAIFVTSCHRSGGHPERSEALLPQLLSSEACSDSATRSGLQEILRASGCPPGTGVRS